jgi:hypothetical protein
VSVVESLGADLAAMGAGLGRAQQETAAADSAAEQIATRAAGSGFVGIAASMSRVRAAIREIGTGIGAVTGNVDEAAAAVAAMPKQPTARETIALLDPLMQKLDGIHGGIGVVMAAIGKAQQVANAVLEGGQPGPMLGRLEAIRQTLLAVVQRNNQAKQHATAALAEAHKTGDQGN